MTKIFARFMKDESGATAIEYGLIAALISVAPHRRRHSTRFLVEHDVHQPVRRA